MEYQISKSIVSSFTSSFTERLQNDVVIVGAGPSGLVAGWKLAAKGFKVSMIEKTLSPGGGMWGGAMFMTRVPVEKEALSVLEDVDVRMEEGEGDFVVINSLELTSALIYKAVHAGVEIFTGMCFEDVLLKNDKVAGVVINWSGVVKDRLHVDPLAVMAKTVLDGTGHPSEVAKTLAAKNNITLATSTGGIVGEKSLSAREGELATVEETKEVFPGLFVSGMAANGVSGSFRMGPIFGGMLLSGEKAANIITEALSS